MAELFGILADIFGYVITIVTVGPKLLRRLHERCEQAYLHHEVGEVAAPRSTSDAARLPSEAGGSSLCDLATVNLVTPAELTCLTGPCLG
ncbi:hypothetical protein MPY17_09110 [Rhodococcus opacus]|uniref:hypothetical protein n=1 Tax=Rhodococcus opacus TaxID=37919 RepID=UPI001FF26300|nr:hypothetical protein [Rhodococcus opacus]UOT05875.1 hypothetical protein MPY17_09110 [Rhodococcus opacus]